MVRQATVVYLQVVRQAQAPGSTAKFQILTREAERNGSFQAR